MRPVIADNYVEHPNALPEWSISGLQAFMGVPIIAANKLLGVMSVYKRRSSKKFTPRDLSMFEALAKETAIAIQNAQLFEALQKELADHKQTLSELENKNAELERFTYTVSHDLKSPIVTIGGFLGFLEEDLAKEKYERIPATINRLREAAKKMERLLNELLELSRIGRLINPPKDIPFMELVEETLELVHGQLDESQAEVKVDTEFPIVHVDKVRMIEVLQNLVVNAIKFTGGQEKPVIEIGMQNQNDEEIFFVKDNGMGVAPEYHERIFGLFNKLDPGSDGTGIGLALVKRIIEVHGGRIWVESEVGKGATFYFTLKNQQENL
jgi:signal transduction histidine kinase